MKISFKDINRLYIVSFIFLGLFPIIPFKLKPLCMVPFIGVSLYYFLRNENRKNINWRYILISSALFFVFLYSIFYSHNLSKGITKISRLLPLFVFPFCFAVIPKNYYSSLQKLLFTVFSVSSALYAILLFVYCWSLGDQSFDYKYAYISNSFWGFNDHPIYISLYLGITLILLSENLKSHLNQILFIIISLALLFLSRKGNLIALFLLFFLMLIPYRRKIFNKKNIGFIGLASLFLIIGIFYFRHNIFDRFREIFYVNEWINNSKTSTGIRYIVWNTCGLLSYEAPLFGYGMGDVQEVINNRLIEYGFSNLIANQKYDAHNEYLQVILTSGYIGLFIFSTVLCYMGYVWIKQKNKMAVYVFLYVIICFIFESILERQNGIMTISLFFNLFLFQPNKK